jgi:hypothetical protein
MISSAIPSAKYSWSFFSLRSPNGSTAIDFSGIALGAGALDWPADTDGCAPPEGRFDRTNLSTAT